MGMTTKGTQTAKQDKLRQIRPKGCPPEGTIASKGVIPLSSQLEAAANSFRDVFDSNAAIYHRTGGQFAVLNEFKRLLHARILNIQNAPLRNELDSLTNGSNWNGLSIALRTTNVRIGDAYQRALPDGDPDKHALCGALRSQSTVIGTAEYKRAAQHARTLMSDPSVSAADKTESSAILDDTSGTGAWAASTMNGWFARSKIGPVTFDKVTLPRQCALFLFSLVGCGSTAQFTGKQLLNTKGIPPGAIPPFTPVALSPFVEQKGRPTIYTKDKRSTPGNLILKYDSTTLLHATNSAKAVLSAGGYLIAGCLSGKDHESDHPSIEHFILIFAAEDGTFLFWDPDVSVTNIASLSSRLGPAIGMLKFDNSDPSAPTFSTGADFADLSAVDPDTGHHCENPLRHRYQILTLAKT